MNNSGLYDQSAMLFGKEAILAYQEERVPEYNLKKLKSKFKFVEPPPQPPPPSPSSPSSSSSSSPLSKILPPFVTVQARHIAPTPKIMPRSPNRRLSPPPFIIDVKPISPINNYSQNLYGSRYDVTDPLINNRCNCYIL